MKVLGETGVTVVEEPLIPEEPTPPGKLGTVGDSAVDREARDEQRERDERAAEAPMKAADLTMGDDIERIITHQFRPVNEFDEYTELRATLKHGSISNISYGELQELLDESEDNAHRAAELLAQVEVAYAGFKFDADSIYAALEAPALEALEEKKAAKKAATGLAGKAIAKIDIDREIKRSHPDEWADLSKKTVRAEKHVALIRDLHRALVERAKHLRTLVGRSRATDS